MSDVYLPPYEHARRPRNAPPRGATDCHAHVFGPFGNFPLGPEREYTPAELPVECYLAMLDEIGFSRGVLVQPSAYGTDCRALLHALGKDRNRLRGIAVVAADVTDAALADMDRQCVRGARFARPPGGLSKGFVGFDVLERLAPRLARLGWHAQIVATCANLVEMVPSLVALGLPLVVDHMGWFDVGRGVSDPAFQGLLRLLGQGQIWLKLTPFRLSKAFPDYEDIAPFHKALVAANPERLVWGSDWPHLHLTEGMPDTGHLVDLFDLWTGDPSASRRILVDNPAALYGF